MISIGAREMIELDATVVEQVYTIDLKSVDFGHPGSIPGGRTKIWTSRGLDPAAGQQNRANSLVGQSNRLIIGGS